MHSFKVHLNESACIKKVRIGLEQVVTHLHQNIQCWRWILAQYYRKIYSNWQEQTLVYKTLVEKSDHFSGA